MLTICGRFLPGWLVRSVVPAWQQPWAAPRSRGPVCAHRPDLGIDPERGSCPHVHHRLISAMSAQGALPNQTRGASQILRGTLPNLTGTAREIPAENLVISQIRTVSTSSTCVKQSSPGISPSRKTVRSDTGSEDQSLAQDCPVSSEREPFYQQVISLISEMRLMESTPSEDRPVIQFHSPVELSQMLPLRLDPAAPALPREDVLTLCRKVADVSVRTCDFRFRNQLYGAVDQFGFGGALLTEALNTNQHTFEVAPAFVLCEAALLERVRQLIGWPEGDGISAAGGSMSNQYGMALARYHRHPEVKRHGMFGMKPLVLFTSADAHYSIQKAAHWHGYGSDNVVAVETDALGRMIPEALEAAVRRVRQEDREPLAVNATCGTTVLGAYDPLPEIADVCQRHDLWLHVDAAWGGAALLSPKLRHLLTGIERADSVVWNAHKLLGAPLQCSIFVTRHPGLLHRTNSAAATYLFQQDKFYDVSFDTGDKSIQCGRKVDAFKLWLMWKAHGEEGLARLVESAYSAAEYCGRQITHRQGFRPVMESVTSQCTNVCFWYVPERLRGRTETDEWWAEVARVTSRIKELMVRRGTLMVGYQPLPHKALVNFFRLVFSAVPELSEKEVDSILDQVEACGKDL